MSFNAPQTLMISHPTLGMGEGNNGYFRTKYENIVLHIISSDGNGWEHVSVSTNKPRCPTWEEMCYVKNLFWDEEDCVIQYHPPKSKYVNNYKCLHMWRKIGSEFETPPEWMVGIK